MTTKADAVASIEGLHLLDAFRTLAELKPGPREVWGFAYSSPWPSDIWPYNVPPGPLDRRIAVKRRSHEYSPPSLRQWRDGGLYISCTGDGVELRLREEDAMEFIRYIHELRREAEMLAEKIWIAMQQGGV